MTDAQIEAYRKDYTDRVNAQVVISQSYDPLGYAREREASAPIQSTTQFDYLDYLYQDIIDAVCNALDNTAQITNVPKLGRVFNMPDGTRGKLQTVSSTYTRGIYSFGIKTGKTVTYHHLPIKSVLYCAITKEYIVL